MPNETPTLTPTSIDVMAGTDLMPFMSMKREMIVTQKKTRSG